MPPPPRACASPMPGAHAALSVHHPQGQRAGAVVARGRVHAHCLCDGDLDRRDRRWPPSQDPVAYRHAAVRTPRPRAHRAALQLAVEQAAATASASSRAGQAWGVAVHESFQSVVAYVVVASMAGQGQGSARPKLARGARRRALQSLHQPAARSRTRCRVRWSWRSAPPCPRHRITLKDGVVEQRQLLRRTACPACTDMPKALAVHIVPSTGRPDRHGRARPAAAGAGTGERRGAPDRSGASARCPSVFA
jgi:hypothetical protein